MCWELHEHLRTDVICLAIDSSLSPEPITLSCRLQLQHNKCAALRLLFNKPGHTCPLSAKATRRAMSPPAGKAPEALIPVSQQGLHSLWSGPCFSQLLRESPAEQQHP